MALPTLTKDNFTGSLKLAVDTYTVEDFNQFCVDKVEYWLLKVLEADTVERIRTTETLPELYTDLLSGVVYVGKDGFNQKFAGLTQILKHFIYAEWRIESNYLHTNTGDVTNLNENAVAAAGVGASIAVNKYNQGIDIYKKVFQFITNFSDQSAEVLSVTPAADSQVVNVAAAKYLVEGAFVSVGGSRLQVTSVGAGVTGIDITLPDSITVFSGQILKWGPFENMPFPKLDYSCF